YFDRLARQSDDSLDEIAIGLDRIFENEHVASLDGTERQKRVFESRYWRRREDELVHEQMVADEQVVLHRPGRDLERLDDEGADQKSQDHRRHHRLEVLAKRRFPERHHRRLRGRRRGDGLAATHLLSPSSAQPETLPAESPRGRRASSASSLPS